MNADVVKRLAAHTGGLFRQPRPDPCVDPLPSRDTVEDILRRLRAVLFPGYFGDPEIPPESLEYHLGSQLDRVRRALVEQVRRGLCFSCPGPERPTSCEADARAIVAAFLDRLPAVQALLAGDVRAAWEGDPAATSPAEAIFCYPGVLALTHYRVAHELHRLGVPLLPRMITEQAHSLTGIDIHPGAEIGERLFMDHGTGIVVGETCVIGNGVRIYQGVTLGAKSFPLDAEGKPVKGVPRHPIIEDDVVIYSNATVLGRVTVGRGSVVGGNVWLTRSVPPGTVVTQQTFRQESFAEGGGI